MIAAIVVFATCVWGTAWSCSGIFVKIVYVVLQISHMPGAVEAKSGQDLEFGFNFSKLHPKSSNKHQYDIVSQGCYGNFTTIDKVVKPTV